MMSFRSSYVKFLKNATSLMRPLLRSFSLTEPLGIMPELQSKQTTVINVDLPLFEKAVFFPFRIRIN